MNDRTWRPVVGYEGLYEVSDDGLVFGVKRRRILRPHFSRGGYPCVGLFRNGIGRTMRIHVLMAEAFIGPRPANHDTRHLDGDPTNCTIGNLRYGTKSENAQDRLRHGRHHNVAKTHCPFGHLYDEVNTYVDPKGSRMCRTCHREKARLARAG